MITYYERGNFILNLHDNHRNFMQAVINQLPLEWSCIDEFLPAIGYQFKLHGYDWRTHGTLMCLVQLLEETGICSMYANSGERYELFIRVGCKYAQYKHPMVPGVTNTSTGAVTSTISVNNSNTQ